MIVVLRLPSEVEDVEYKSIELVDAVSVEEYQESIILVFNNELETAAYTDAYEALLNMRVPVTYKDLHIDLTIAVAQLRDGNVDAGQVRLDLLKAQIDWLP